MEKIEIIKNKSELEGSWYIELSIGKYSGKHWQETSLYFEEEIFGLIEPIFGKRVEKYDHYGMNDANVESWNKIIIDLNELKDFLESENDFANILGKINFVCGDSRDYFQTHLQECKAQLCKMIQELVNWADVNIKKHGYIAILGI